MDKAKQSVKEFLSGSGQHETSVHKTQAAPVQHETVKPIQRENVTEAVDREVHQDHYHQTVQPIKDREVLPEQHTHKMGEVEHRTFDKRDLRDTKDRLSKESGKFKDERTVQGTQYSQSHAPVEGSEHIHHHIHEQIQPVIHKETVQPNIIHSTKPIHEVHHEPAQLHGTTALPAVSMSDYKKSGGALGGKTEDSSRVKGQPKDLGGVKSAAHGGFDPADEGIAGGGVTGSTGKPTEKPTGNTGTVAGQNFGKGLLDRLNPLSS
ncbi:hypothetical protein F5Y16DRAFT_397785 [Xylariaceae sp. FL0255]|nr:hypothetical protein F5Y16DRAFT_397785 [Xylariaceae sp. FL0255]